MDEIESIRREVEKLGFTQIKSPSEVETLPEEFFMFINSWCPNSSYARSMLTKIRPKYESMFTIFAGQDIDATEHFRAKYYIRPSSPALYYVKKGRVVFEMRKEEILASNDNSLQERLSRIL